MIGPSDHVTFCTNKIENVRKTENLTQPLLIVTIQLIASKQQLEVHTSTHTTFIFINHLVVIELIFQQLGIINKGVGILY